MKYQNLLDILMLLLSRKKISANEIANRLDISTRSVYRYIEELSVSGIPVTVSRGRYGGISILDTFKLPAGYFTRDEYTAAINALTAFSEQLGDKATYSALEKLQRQQKIDKRESTICGNVIVDGGSWTDTTFTQKMKTCEQAVNENLCLQIDYISREGEHSVRIIDPHVLIYKHNVWYVYAFCHTKGEFRTFKIGRMRDVQFNGNKFVKQPITKQDIDLNFYYVPEDLIEVELEIKKDALATVEEWLGIDCISPRGDKLIANVHLANDNMLVNTILGYGGAVKVLAPKDLKEKVQATAKMICEN